MERILAAAEHDIGRLGLAAAGTRGIAARAGLSVGALYRFFPDKEAIADALARRYLADLMPAYAGTVEDIAPGHRPGQRGHHTGPPGRGEPAGAPRLLPAHRGAPPEQGDSPAHQVREQIVDLFAGALRSAGVEETDAEVRRVVALSVETVRHALVRAPVDPAGRQRAVDELARMVAAYVRDRFA